MLHDRQGARVADDRADVLPAGAAVEVDDERSALPGGRRLARDAERIPERVRAEGEHGGLEGGLRRGDRRREECPDDEGERAGGGGDAHERRVSGSD